MSKYTKEQAQIWLHLDTIGDAMGGVPAFLGNRVSKARKEYACSWCGEKIKPGEYYFRENRSDGNSILSIAVCGDCCEESTGWMRNE